MNYIFYIALFSFSALFGYSSELDEYLEQHGLHLSPVHSIKNEGYSSEAQRLQFFEDLQKLPHIKHVAEIGFNAGHSTETFLKASDHISLTSFDINHHPYTNAGVEFMKKKYASRFEFIQGDSLATVKEYAKVSAIKFDLVFIDGCHAYHCALNDLINCKALSHEGTEIWIDDYDAPSIIAAAEECMRKGILTIDSVLSVSDASGKRTWAKGKYIF
jgi:predicted O-methyltransferase YrrM